MTRPAYNHTPTDSEMRPCTDCRIAQLEREAVKMGASDQKERWHAGVLPDDELLAIARAELFKPFDDLPRWKMLKPEEVRHDKDCKVVKAVQFNTVDRVRLSRSEWTTMNRITAMAALAGDHPWLRGETFTVTLRCHLATCAACKAETDGVSAVVSVSWAGRTLSREYAL